MIEVKNLTKQYGEQKAVNNISFSVKKGEIVGFLGPNGAGKSTTMKMITGFLEPDQGDITVSGIDVRSAPLEAKKKVGYLPESNPLYYDMYVREYLRFVSEVHDIPNKKATIEKVIDQVGLRQEAAKRIGQLSKGYKQRVGLAAALIHDPEVLILDEPTTGLDPNQIIEIRNVIREQGKDKLVLFSSHILQEVEAICDRVIIIHKGHLVADDQVKNLQKRKAGTIVRISFQHPPKEDWMKEIRSAESIVKNSPVSWSITTSDPEAVRKQLLELSLQHNLNIVSLQSEDQSLEEVFRSLTK
jgi:ABC-2 type transport system ATP-binding protein